MRHSQIGLIAMLPSIVATIAMVLWSRHSDKRNERKLHSAVPLLVAARGDGGHCQPPGTLTDTNPARPDLEPR